MARKDSPDDPQPLAGKEAASRANRSLDAALRPPKLDDFVGQQRTVRRVRTARWTPPCARRSSTTSWASSARWNASA